MMDNIGTYFGNKRTKYGLMYDNFNDATMRSGDDDIW